MKLNRPYIYSLICRLGAGVVSLFSPDKFDMGKKTYVCPMTWREGLAYTVAYPQGESGTPQIKYHRLYCRCGLLLREHYARK